MADYLEAYRVLQGYRVCLEPLSLSHLEGIRPHTRDPRIWEHLILFDPDEPGAVERWLGGAIELARTGTSFPFVIMQPAPQRVLGMTALYEYAPEMRRITLGRSWLSPEVWGSGVNNEAKYLLLKFAFEALEIHRVQTRVDVMNVRSRRAVEKLGFVEEGVLRGYLLHEDGRPRDMRMFSLLQGEWPALKARLEQRIQRGAR